MTLWSQQQEILAAYEVEYSLQDINMAWLNSTRYFFDSFQRYIL